MPGSPVLSRRALAAFPRYQGAGTPGEKAAVASAFGLSLAEAGALHRLSANLVRADAEAPRAKEQDGARARLGVLLAGLGVDERCCARDLARLVEPWSEREEWSPRLCVLAEIERVLLTTRPSRRAGEETGMADVTVIEKSDTERAIDAIRAGGYDVTKAMMAETKASIAKQARCSVGVVGAALRWMREAAGIAAPKWSPTVAVAEARRAAQNGAAPAGVAAEARNGPAPPATSAQDAQEQGASRAEAPAAPLEPSGAAPAPAARAEEAWLQAGREAAERRRNREAAPAAPAADRALASLAHEPLTREEQDLALATAAGASTDLADLAPAVRRRVLLAAVAAIEAVGGRVGGA